LVASIEPQVCRFDSRTTAGVFLGNVAINFLYIVGGASKVWERFHFQQTKLCNSEEVIEMLLLYSLASCKNNPHTTKICIPAELGLGLATRD